MLVFAVPSSPMAQPWSVIGGNIISTVIGVLVYQAVPDMGLAASFAVGAAILIMSLLRCLHPPGGASALTAVIGSDAIHTAGLEFALLPVGIKLVVFPVLVIGLGLLAGLDRVTIGLLALCASVPTAMNGYLLAKSMGGDAPFYAAVATLQTAASFVTIPLVLAMATLI